MNRTPPPPPIFDNFYAFSDGNSSDLNRLDDDTTTSDLMDGNIHLIVNLLGGRKIVEMDVDAKTPMMDLLIKIAASNGLNPVGLYLKTAVAYKPSTPIGKLNCREVFLVDKLDDLKPPSSNSNSLPFEPTIRVSIDLPRNQKTFLRLNADSTLEQVLVEIVRRQKDRLLTSNSPHILENFALKSLKRPDLVLNLRKSLKETGFVDFKLLELQGSDSQKSNDVFYQYTKMDLEDKKRGLDCGKSLKFFSLFKKKPKKEKPKSLNSSIVNLNREIDQKSSSIDDSYWEKSTSMDRKCEISIKNGKTNQKRRAPLPPPIQSSSTNENSTSGGVVSGVKKIHAPLSSYAKNANETHQPRKLVAAKSQLTSDGNFPPTEMSDVNFPTTETSPLNAYFSSTETSKLNGNVSPPTETLNGSFPPSTETLRRTESVGVSSSAKRKSKAPPPPKPLRNDSLVKTPKMTEEKSDSTVATVIDDITVKKVIQLDEKNASSSNGNFVEESKDSLKASATVIYSENSSSTSDIIAEESKNSESACATVIDHISQEKPEKLQYTGDELASSGLNAGCTTVIDHIPLEKPEKLQFTSDESAIFGPNGGSATVIDHISLEKPEELQFTGDESSISGPNEEPFDEKIVNFSSKTGEFNNDYSKLDDGTTTIIMASSPEMAKNIENVVMEISSPRQTSSPIVEKMHLFSSKSIKNGHSRTKFSSNILQNAHFQPAMRVKSFEDEYLEKENAKKLAENGEILSSKFVVCPKNGAFDGASQLEMGDLDVEYQKLQDLFQEWKILSDANDQNNNNLTTSQMLNFQRLQTKVLEQHEFVQNLYEKQEKQEKPCLQKTLQSISQNLNFTPGKSSICKATVNNKCKAPDFSENEDLMSAIRRFGGVNGLRKANGKSA